MLLLMGTKIMDSFASALYKNSQSPFEMSFRSAPTREFGLNSSSNHSSSLFYLRTPPSSSSSSLSSKWIILNAKIIRHLAVLSPPIGFEYNIFNYFNEFFFFLELAILIPMFPIYITILNKTFTPRIKFKRIIF